jgi:hypothetical protein
MPLVVNGVTIPTNVANVLGVNGVNIQNVYCNGVHVWHQSLAFLIPTYSGGFNYGGWAGSWYLNQGGAGHMYGIRYSGNLLAWAHNSSAYSAVDQGWISVNGIGQYSANPPLVQSEYIGYGGLETSGNLLRLQSGAWISLTASGYSGSSNFYGYWWMWGDDCDHTLETSGFSIRFSAPFSGHWMSVS